MAQALGEFEDTAKNRECGIAVMDLLDSPLASEAPSPVHCEGLGSAPALLPLPYGASLISHISVGSERHTADFKQPTY